MQSKYKLVPPDGGWGYMICLAAIIIYSSTSMFSGAFGIIFNDFMQEIGMNSTSMTALNGVNAMCIAISGFFVGPLMKVMSMRNLALLGALSFNTGLFCMVFVNSIVPFFICQGVLQNIGVGILYNLSCTALNDYFLKRRLMFISISQTMSAASGMVAPQFIRWSLDEFGFRGTLLLISGVSLQIFVAISLMQPVAWHMKKVQSTDDVPDEEVTNADDVKPKEENVLKSMFQDLLDKQFLKAYFLSNVSFGLTFCVVSEFAFILMVPSALFSMGWSKEAIALTLSLCSMSDMVTRISIIFLSKWLTKLGSHEIYVAGLVVAFLSRIGMLTSSNTSVVMASITVMGVSRCTLTTLPPLVIADSVPPSQFSTAMGMFMMLYGTTSLIFGPCIGAVRDATGSYTAAFYIPTACYAIVAMLWTIEIWHRRTNMNKVN